MSQKDLQKIRLLALKAHGLKTEESFAAAPPYWDASFFQVNESDLYLSLQDSQKTQFFAIDVGEHFK